MSDLFTETKPENIKECYASLKASGKMFLDGIYIVKELEHKLKTDYAEFRDFRNKNGEPLANKVKQTYLKVIYNILNVDKKEDGLKLLKDQENLLINVLESFDDNEKNNELFKLGAGKKPENIEELINYIVDYRNKDLDNELINSIILQLNKNGKIKEEEGKTLDEFTGLIPKDEIKVIKELVKIMLIPYAEKLEADFRKKNEMKPKKKVEKVGIEETALEKLSNIVNEKYSDIREEI